MNVLLAGANEAMISALSLVLKVMRHDWRIEEVTLFSDAVAHLPKKPDLVVVCGQVQMSQADSEKYHLGDTCNFRTSAMHLCRFIRQAQGDWGRTVPIACCVAPAWDDDSRKYCHEVDIILGSLCGQRVEIGLSAEQLANDVIVAWEYMQQVRSL